MYCFFYSRGGNGQLLDVHYPGQRWDEVEESEAGAAVSKIFAKQKKKRDKMKRCVKQAVRDKEQRENEITIEEIIQECSKAAGAGGENMEASEIGRAHV